MLPSSPVCLPLPRCSSGYHGNPRALGGTCQRCDCSPSGSFHGDCDRGSGQCVCRPGATGLRCEQCEPRHILLESDCVCAYSPPPKWLKNFFSLDCVPVTAAVGSSRRVHKLRKRSRALLGRARGIPCGCGPGQGRGAKAARAVADLLRGSVLPAYLPSHGCREPEPRWGSLVMHSALEVVLANWLVQIPEKSVQTTSRQHQLSSSSSL